ncbi:CoxS Aerobic-type carbon monoxide dehydrogenase, small subunit CoxS/CutS homologs [Burkholderiaceae bacterium]|jgi:nicotinate dehydrogenase subunit A
MQPLRTVDVQLQVNGQDHALRLTSAATLLHVLRNDLGLNSPKFGCGLGQCGACTVLIDGTPARACVIPAQEIQHRDITTSEGLGQASAPHPVQQAFIDEQAAQCGYCLNGMVMMTVALLKRCPDPTDSQIRQALSGNLCRCGTHVEIMAAVKRAARLMHPTPA